MLYYLFTFKLKDTNSIINIEEEYTGAAKNPDELSEPNEYALRELERLLGDN